MRGILYPASNVIFAAQDDLAKQPKPEDASTSPNPLTTTYGGWQAVENAALAIAESANLVMMPGRMCSNGKPAPIGRADWVKDVQRLREAGRAAYKAAQKKDTDAIVDVSGHALGRLLGLPRRVSREKDRTAGSVSAINLVPAQVVSYSCAR